MLTLIAVKNLNIHTSIFHLIAGKELDKYLPTEDYFQKGLYMFDIGQNDLAGAFYSKTFDQVLSLIPSALTEFETGIKVSFKNSTLVLITLRLYLFICFSSSRFPSFLMQFLHIERHFIIITSN